MAPLSFDADLARQVKADTLEPRQRPTSPRFKTAADFSQQAMLKHPHLSDFHSPAEHLHAGLLEADPTVISYVPQPYALRVGQRRYTPDCYVVRDGQPREVLELKPGGHLEAALREPVAAFLAQHGVRFTVLSNEAVFERRLEAENWLEIVRILYQARDLDTTVAEAAVRERLAHTGPCTLGAVSDAGDRGDTYPQEIALFRLLHRGELTATLTERYLDFDTVFSPWSS